MQMPFGACWLAGETSLHVWIHMPSVKLQIRSRLLQCRDAHSAAKKLRIQDMRVVKWLSASQHHQEALRSS